MKNQSRNPVAISKRTKFSKDLAKHERAARRVTMLAQDTTVEIAFNNWIQRKSGILTPSYLQRIQNEWTQYVLPLIGQLRPTDVHTHHLEELEIRIRETRTPQGLFNPRIPYRMMRSVIRLFDSFYNDGIIERPVRYRITKPRRLPAIVIPTRQIITFLAEVDRLIGRGDPLGQLWVRLILLSGLRPTEISSLTFKCIDVRNRVILVPRQMANFLTPHPMPQLVEEALLSIGLDKSDRRIFPACDASSWAQQTRWRKAIRFAGQSVGLTAPVNPTVLRSTWKHLMRNFGVPTLRLFDI